LLLTGVDNHLNGLGVMPPMHTMSQFRKQGYEGTLNSRVMTIAENLRDNGYATLLSWHLGRTRPSVLRLAGSSVCSRCLAAAPVISTTRCRCLKVSDRTRFTTTMERT